MHSILGRPSPNLTHLGSHACVLLVEMHSISEVRQPGSAMDNVCFRPQSLLEPPQFDWSSDRERG
jgi:hypothetical protein